MPTADEVFMDRDLAEERSCSQPRRRTDGKDAHGERWQGIEFYGSPAPAPGVSAQGASQQVIARMKAIIAARGG